MANYDKSAPIEILLVEDNPADIRLTEEGLREGKIANNLYAVMDGGAALDFLFKRGDYENAVTPDLILLDLNLPGVDGREVLKTIKNDEHLRVIPVVVMTSSEAETDVVKSYSSHANCYISKPVDFDGFVDVVKSIEKFWFTVVKLPSSF